MRKVYYVTEFVFLTIFRIVKNAKLCKITKKGDVIITFFIKILKSYIAQNSSFTQKKESHHAKENIKK